MSIEIPKWETSFIDAFQKLSTDPKSNYIAIDDSKEEESYTIVEDRKGVLTHEQISDKATKIFRTITETKSFKNALMDTPFSLLEKLDESLLVYAERVEKSAKNRWWVKLLDKIGIHSFFGHPLAQKPKDIMGLHNLIQRYVDNFQTRKGGVEESDKMTDELIRKEEEKRAVERQKEIAKIISKCESQLKEDVKEINKWGQGKLFDYQEKYYSDQLENLVKRKIHSLSDMLIPKSAGHDLRESIEKRYIDQLNTAKDKRLETIHGERYKYIRKHAEEVWKKLPEMRKKTEDLREKLNQNKLEVSTLDELRGLLIKIKEPVSHNIFLTSNFDYDRQDPFLKKVLDEYHSIYTLGQEIMIAFIKKSQS